MNLTESQKRRIIEILIELTDRGKDTEHYIIEDSHDRQTTTA